MKAFSLIALAKITLAAFVELTTENLPKNLLNDHQFAIVVYHNGRSTEEDWRMLDVVKEASKIFDD